jgi:hypothetical protein
MPKKTTNSQRISALEAEVKRLRETLDALLTGLRTGTFPTLPSIPWLPKPSIPMTPTVVMYGVQTVGGTGLPQDQKWYGEITVTEPPKG